MATAAARATKVSSSGVIVQPTIATAKIISARRAGVSRSVSPISMAVIKRTDMAMAPSPAETAPNLTGFGRFYLPSSEPRFCGADLLNSTDVIFTFTN